MFCAHDAAVGLCFVTSGIFILVVFVLLYLLFCPFFSLLLFNTLILLVFWLTLLVSLFSNVVFSWPAGWLSVIPIIGIISLYLVKTESDLIGFLSFPFLFSGGYAIYGVFCEFFDPFYQLFAV